MRVRTGRLVPVIVGLAGAVLSCIAYWMADRADEARVRAVLESRAEWRARDLEAKIRLSGNAVENIAVALAANRSLTPDQFSQLAARAGRGLQHVNSLQWAPRVARAGVAAFEQTAQVLGLSDYRLFDVTPDFQRTALSDRPEYFPVLFDVRFHGGRSVPGLALGKHEGRRIPMEHARDAGGPTATPPLKPVGPEAKGLVYLLFWPVYDTIAVPGTVSERREHLSGYAVGNYDLGGMLTAALRNTPDLIETIHFGIVRRGVAEPGGETLAIYSPATGTVLVGEEITGEPHATMLNVRRTFTVFDQAWTLDFEYAPETVNALRSSAAWGWLFAGLLLTLSLAFYLWREGGRTQAIEALVAARTAELQRTAEQLHQSQKMEAIGNLTGGMAHDFNNLLAVVIGNLDMLQVSVKGNAEAEELTDSALQASLRGAELTRQLLAFARRQPLEPKVTDVNDLVTGATRLLARILEEHIEVKLVTPPGVWPVLIDPAQLTSAIANLATNARDAMPNGGQLTIETKNTHLDADYAALNPDVAPGDYVLLEVSDTGTGMSPETLTQVFEPFFTTKPEGHGTGLGLSMVFGFVKQSKGHIKVYSEVGHGTSVRIYLPRSRQDVPASAPAGAVATERQRAERILVVEDNPGVRDMVLRQLESLGYTALAVDSAQSALSILKDPTAQVDLLFTDLVMPGGMNGAELARIAEADRPGLRVLFTSGYSDTVLRGGDRLRAGEHFLSKPYRKQELAAKLSEIFGH